METELINSLTNNFESFANKTEDGVSFWFARDLQQLLGYTKWDNFKNVIFKAKTACEVSNQEVSDHFADVGKMVQIGSGATKEIDDIMLTRYACYLIAQNGDSKKEQIAFAQTYFATEITIYNAKDKLMNTENEISNEHITNNKAVRDTLLSRGIVPEKVKPEEDIKKVERKLNSETKKTLNSK